MAYDTYLFYPVIFFYENNINNFLIALIGIFFQLFYIIYFSGKPFLNNSLKKKYNYFNLLTFFWAIGRLLTGTMDLLFNVYYKRIFINLFLDPYENSNINVIIYMTILIFCLFFSEILPFLYVLNVRTMKCFLITQKTALISSLQDQKSNVIQEESLMKMEFSEEKQQISSRRNSSISMYLSEIKAEEYIGGKSFLEKTQRSNSYARNVNCLGLIRTFPLEKAAIRIILADKIHTFIREEIQRDILNLKILDDKYCQKIFNYSYENVSLTLVYDYYENSLRKLMENNIKFNFNEVILLAYKIAEAINYLHGKNISHGHINPNNIFINNYNKEFFFSDDYNTVIIGDIGLLALKKNSGIYLGYSNKSKYTSPETLKENGLVVKIHIGREIFIVLLLFFGNYYIRMLLLNRLVIRN